MSNKMAVAICSRGRSELLANRCKTFKYLGKSPVPVYLIVREEEVDDYLVHAIANDISVKTVPNDYRISQKRHSALFQLAEEGYDSVFFVDDDLDFSPRNETYTSNYAKGEIPAEDVFRVMAKQMQALTSEIFPVVGVMFRQGSMGAKKPFYYTKKVNGAWSVHLETYFRECEGMDHAPYGVMEDYFTFSQLRSKGYLVPTIASFVFSEGGRASGGCSSYRSMEEHNAAVEWFLKVYPKYTSCKEVEANTAWTEKRKEVVWDWSSLYEGKALPAPTDVMAMMVKNGYDEEKLMPWRKGHANSK